MTIEEDSRTAESWPVVEFNAYLEARMRDRGIPSRHQLAQDSGVSAMALSAWRRGLSQPTPALLERIAPVLGVGRVELWIRAGRIRRDELVVDDDLARVRRFVDLRTQLPGSWCAALDADIALLVEVWRDQLERKRLRRDAA